MAEDLLDSSQIGPRFEQVRCKGMTHRVARHPPLDPRLHRRAFDRFVVDLPVEVMTAPEAAFRIDR